MTPRARGPAILRTMSVVLPQPSARTSAAIAVAVLAAGFVVAVALVRGVLAADFMWAVMQQGPDPVPAPPAPPPPSPR